MVQIKISRSYNLGFQVQLEFQITQHTRDEQLMNSLVSYFGCGNVYKHRKVIDFKVTKFRDLTEKVIPFFDKYQIIGVKAKDYKDFKKAIELIKNKVHLTSDGLEEIKKIKVPPRV
jgi:hypothetical protein